MEPSLPTFEGVTLLSRSAKTLKDEYRRETSNLRGKPFLAYTDDFTRILGQRPRLIQLISLEKPYAHEAGVYLHSERSLIVTSNQFLDEAGQRTVEISKILRNYNIWDWHKVDPDIDIPFANGGVNYKEGVLFCAQGSLQAPGGLIYVGPDEHATVVVDSFHGRPFNSVNDVVIASDGSVWFTDPTYGYEQGIRPEPQLPPQVYRFNPRTGDIRVVADDLKHPNGICFSPGEDTVYITDTDNTHGTGRIDLKKVSTIYAYDVLRYHKAPFLGNKRVFAMATEGAPDGIKCDMEGNVYSGCGNGVHVWSPGGVLLGKILVEGGVANFCFGEPGELFLLNETKVWQVLVSKHVRGALLKL